MENMAKHIFVGFPMGMPIYEGHITEALYMRGYGMGFKV